MSRSFTIDSSNVGHKGGTYRSDLPCTAAPKAAKILFRHAKETNGPNTKKVFFTLRETTRGSGKSPAPGLPKEKKMFMYEATKLKADPNEGFQVRDKYGGVKTVRPIHSYSTRRVRM
jgi:hypothetical protein